MRKGLSFLFISCLLVAGSFGVANATSVSWNITEGALHSPDTSFGSRNASANVYNPVMSFEYRAYVKNADTGEIIIPGGTVAVGTRLEFSFDTHQSSDVSWVGSGGAYDSPYGEWRSGATAPTRQCHADDFVMSGWSNTNGGFGYGNYSMYVNMAVHPPIKTVLGLSGLSCDTPASDGSVVCTANGSGTIPAEFSFDETYAKFYPQIKSGTQCRVYNQPMSISHTTWQYAYGTSLSIPEKTISYPIVIAGEEGSEPNDPSVSAALGGQCIVGTPFSITMSATDADGDSVRYGIDWDADDSIDQFAPASGYVSSGTSQTATRTYSEAGDKTIQVLAQDQHGYSSGWSEFSFSCDEEALDDGGFEDGGEGEGEGDGGLAPEPDVTFRALPSMVRFGDTTRLSWSAVNVDSCAVSGGGVVASGTSSPEGGFETNPIEAQTTFTLMCTGEGGSITKNATVNILPVWNEQ